MNDNLELRKRFVSDENIPIQVLVSPYFEDRLDLFEERYKSRTKYEKLLKLIEKEFDGSQDKFLQYYYKTRDSIISDIQKSKRYQKFNTCDISEFNVVNSYPKNNLYCSSNANEIFISIDMKNANFQALRFYDKYIFYMLKSYEDFVGIFTKLDYFKKSKYTRQVVFGQLNPKRTTKIETYIMSMAYELFLKEDFFSENAELFSLTTDEIILKVTNKDCDFKEKLNWLKNEIKKILDIEVSIEMVKIEPIKFMVNEKNTITVFKRSNIVSNEEKLMCVPSIYMPQVIRLLKGEKIQETDRVFMFEKCLATFNQEIKLID